MNADILSSSFRTFSTSVAVNVALLTAFVQREAEKKRREREKEKLCNGHRLARVQLIRGMQALPYPQATFQRDSQFLVYDQHSTLSLLFFFKG